MYPADSRDSHELVRFADAAPTTSVRRLGCGHYHFLHRVPWARSEPPPGLEVALLRRALTAEEFTPRLPAPPEYRNRRTVGWKPWSAGSLPVKSGAAPTASSPCRGNRPLSFPWGMGLHKRLCPPRVLAAGLALETLGGQSVAGAVAQSSCRGGRRRACRKRTAARV